jgi:uncharacterized membrane protein YfcA
VVASVSGFGIGSLLTPAFALAVDARLAVALAALPHAAGTLQRLWLLRRHLDRRVFGGFGVASALGGLAGGLLQTRAPAGALSAVFGALLLAAGTFELTGVLRRVRWSRRAAWAAGTLSGVLGGLVGNQGGVRTAAMLGFEVAPAAFVATATAAALLVDAARVPVYLATQGDAVWAHAALLAPATLGVVVGTAVGARVLGALPPPAFRRAVAVLLLALGAYMLAQGARSPAPWRGRAGAAESAR